MGLLELAERLEKRASQDRSYSENNRIVAELLQPQLDRFDARNPDEPWNTYAVRMQLDHRNSAKRDAESADDLEQAASELRALSQRQNP